jgi:hypothetical protein
MGSAFSEVSEVGISLAGFSAKADRDGGPRRRSATASERAANFSLKHAVV